jgi:RNA-directed DNA polymerase
LGNLSTPKTVQKLQKALHAKAKAEAGYRFYALYDKISRDDILAHAYAQCRSNKGAPGVDGQDFADIETYGVERWLGELALALREESYQPDPIRRVFIPKANGKLRPLGISTVRDRVCMTAAMLVLEPIFEADLPPEQYAYRPGRNAQQAVVEVEELLFRGHPEVVDADLADYFGSIPHAELLQSVARRIVDRRVLPIMKIFHFTDLSVFQPGQFYIEELTEPQGLRVLIECPCKHPSCFWAKASKPMIIKAARTSPATRFFIMATTPRG